MARGWMAAALFVVATGCPSAPPPRPKPSDFATMNSLMGTNQKLVFSLQSYVGDPIEADKVRRNLDTLAAHFETIQALRPYDDDDKNQKLRGWSAQIAR